MTTASVKAISFLKAVGGSIVDPYRGPRAQPVVFPPPSWEIDDETYKKSKGTASPPPEQPSEPPISFAKRIGALIDSLPTSSTAAAPVIPSIGQVQDEGKQGSPVPPEMDKDLVRMLASEQIMNGQSSTNDNPNRKSAPQHSSNIWNILAGLKSTAGLKNSEAPPARTVEEDQRGIMVYSPLEPDNDSHLELAQSDTVLEYVDEPVPAASTSIIPESGNKIEGSTATSTNPATPTPAPHNENHRWVPSTTQLSVLATWWGYRLYLPPPVMTKLNGTSLKATARAAMLTTALKWLLDKIPLMMIPVQFRPAVKMLKTLSPLVGYVGVFIAWSWDRVKSLDKGNGVVLTATWLLPVALLPMPWDAGDIYGPKLESQQENDAHSNPPENKKGNGDKGKEKQAKKKSIFPW